MCRNKLFVFDNLHFPPKDVNFEIWVLKATVRKVLVSSIVSFGDYHEILLSIIILLHKVKTQYVHCSLTASYFPFPWRNPAEMNRRSSLLQNLMQYLLYQTCVNTRFWHGSVLK